MSGRKPRKHTSSLGVPLQVSHESLTRLLEISPDALIVVDRAGTILMVNEQVEALYGYAHDELSGQPLGALLPARFHERHALLVERYFSAPRTRPMGTGLQLFSRRKDGSEFPADISLRPVLLDNALYVRGYAGARL